MATTPAPSSAQVTTHEPNLRTRADVEEEGGKEEDVADEENDQKKDWGVEEKKVGRVGEEGSKEEEKEGEKAQGNGDHDDEEDRHRERQKEEDEDMEEETSTRRRTSSSTTTVDLQSEQVQSSTRLQRALDETAAASTATTRIESKQPDRTTAFGAASGTFAVASSSKRLRNDGAPAVSPVTDLEAEESVEGSKPSAISEDISSFASAGVVNDPPIAELSPLFHVVGLWMNILAGICLVTKRRRQAFAAWFTEKRLAIVTWLRQTTSVITAWLQRKRSSILAWLHQASMAIARLIEAHGITIIRWLNYIGSWIVRIAFVAFITTVSPAEGILYVAVWLTFNVAGGLAVRHRRQLLAWLEEKRLRIVEEFRRTPGHLRARIQLAPVGVAQNAGQH